jgi:hypothetical protein
LGRNLASAEQDTGAGADVAFLYAFRTKKSGALRRINPSCFISLVIVSQQWISGCRKVR